MKVLAVASGGGHWIQLLRLRPALAGNDVTFVTTDPGYREYLDGEPLLVVNDANRWNKFGLVLLALRVLLILLRIRPDVVISTGAAPGFFALRLGRLLGARTIWIDSMANVEKLSMSGERIGRHADLWLTQWAHLAREDGPSYRGSVL